MTQTIETSYLGERLGVGFGTTEMVEQRLR